MKRFHILLAAPLQPDGLELLRQDEAVVILDQPEKLGELDAILVSPGMPIDETLIAGSRQLKIIACLGAQLDALDLDHLTEEGIAVVFAPDRGVTAVAEYTFAMLLALSRRIVPAALAVDQDRESRPLPGFELAGKTLGIVGLGRVGRQVATQGHAFGMHILAYDPYIEPGRTHPSYIEQVGFHELLARSDIVTLHPSLTQETRGMLGKDAFALIKPGAILVNCTHAGLVDSNALLAALKSGKISAAALDTYPFPSTPAEQQLVIHPHVLATPHLNQQTAEAQAGTSRQVVQDMLAALREDDYRNIANLPFSAAIPYQVARPYIQLAARLGRLQGQLAEGWITRLEVELLGNAGSSDSALQELIRPVTAMLLAGMLRPIDGRQPNWISAPAIAFKQGISMAQMKGLVNLADYPNLLACRIYWDTGQRTVAGVLFGNGEARLVQYDRFQVDAYPDGYVLILENEDVPGVIGRVGTRLGNAGINIAQWRYGREHPGGKAVSFINLDSRPPQSILRELEQESDIYRARLVRL